MAFYNEDEKKKNGLPQIVKPAHQNKAAAKANQTATLAATESRMKSGAQPKPSTSVAKSVFPTQKAPTVAQAPKNSWTGKQYSDVTYAEYKAFAKKTGAPQEILEQLEYETTLPGSQFYNPYKGGNSTQMQAAKDAFRTLTGGDVTFDDNFFNQFNYLRNSVVRSETTGNLTTPNKNFSLEQTCAYWYEQALMDKQATANVQSQYDEVRAKYAESYADFKAVYQREPTFDEFASFVDISKYSALDKILNVSYDSADPQKVSQLNTGTFFDRDTVTGLYYAIQNGEDITVDRDYTEDAVNYYMNPVQSSPVIQKYPWSNVDLNTVDERGLGLYIQELGRLGEMEELAALRHAIWASKPHKEGMVTESILNDTYGYYHDNAWFEAAHAAVGDEYEVRLTEDGKMSKPGSNASLMDRACYELWQEEQKRVETDEVEAALEEIKSTIAAYKPASYDVEEFDIFCRDVRSAVKGLDNYSVVEDYINGKTDTCRDIFVSEDTINAMIGRQWKGLSISENVDYGVTFAEGYEDAFTPDDTPEEPPMFYDEMQEQAAIENLADRQNNKMTIAQAVFAFSQSGANISNSNVPVDKIISQTYLNAPESGEILTSIWYALRSSEYADKLGEGYSFDQAVASDPTLKAISGVTGVVAPRDLTVADILLIGHLSAQSDIANEDMTFTAGVVENALPGLSYLCDYVDGMYEKYGIHSAYEIINGSLFDVAVYKNSYQQSIFAGVSPKAAAEKAYNEAVNVAIASKSIQQLYDGDADLTAAATELTQQIKLEEGMDEVVEIVSGINDDVMANAKPALGEDGSAVDMTAFNSAMLIGSTSFADPGFAAMTKDIIHDITTGDITPEEISKVLSLTNAERTLLMMPAPGAAPEETFEPDRDRKIVMVSGVEITASEHAALLEEQRRVSNGEIPFDQMSDTLKTVIKYDELMAFADEKDAEGVAVDRPSLIAAALSAANPENTNGDYRPTELMHGATDVEGKIAAFTSLKNADQIAQNVTEQERNLIQQFIESDSYNFLPRIAAVLGFSTSDTYHVVERLQNNSKFFSAQELSSLLTSYTNGHTTKVEVDAIIDDRLSDISNEYVNALNHPAALSESYETMEANLANVDADKKDAYTMAVDMYRAMGENGYLLVALSNEDIKNITGGALDLEAAGTTMVDVLNEVGGNWTAPYSNDGTGDVLDTIFGGLSKSIGGFAAIPHKAAHWFGHLIGDKHTSETLQNLNAIDRNEAEYATRVQSAAEAFVQQGIAEMSRILITSSFGSMLGNFVGGAAGLAQAGSKARMLTKIAGRVPFATSTFVNDSYDYLMKGEPILKATIKSSLHTAIELGTESLPLEKFASVKIGGASLYGRAMSVIGRNTPMATAWLSQTAKNVVTEIGEEEISMVLNRIVDFGDYVISGKDVNTASAMALEGIGSDAIATAQATAFTTLLLGVVDLGGMTYQGFRMHMELGTEYNAEDLIRDIQVDLALAEEEAEADSYDPATEIPEFKKPSKPTSEDAYIEAASKAALSGNEDDVEVAVQAAETYAEELSNAGESEPAPAEEAIEPAPEEVVEQTETPATAAPEASEDTAVVEETESAQNETTAVEQPEPQFSTPGEQKVYNYIKEAETNGIPGAIANAGAKAKAKAATESDPRVDRAKQAHESKKRQVSERKKAIERLKAERDSVIKRREQAVRAAIDEGVESNGSVMTNTLAQHNQQIAGIEEDVAEETIKLEQATQEEQAAAIEVTEVTEQVEQETAAEARRDLIARMQKFKAESDREAEQYANARTGKDGETVIEALETDEERQENYLRSWDARRDAAKGYSSHVLRSGLSSADPIHLFDYVDPANYPVSTERYTPDWQEERKAEEESRIRYNEAHTRILEEFVASENSKGEMIEVPEDVYNNVVKNMQEELGYIDKNHVATRSAYHEEHEDPRNSIVDADGNVKFEPDIERALLGIVTNGKSNKTHVEGKWQHVTENDQYLVIKHVSAATDPTEETGISDKTALGYLTKRNKSDNKTGFERLQDRMKESEARMKKEREKHMAASRARAEAAAAFDRDNSKENAAAYQKAVAEDERASRMHTQATVQYQQDYDRFIKASRRYNEINARIKNAKNAPTRYIAIDKNKLAGKYSFDFDKAVDKRVNEEMRVLGHATPEEIVELCVALKMADAGNSPEAESAINAVRSVYKKWNRADLTAEYRALLRSDIAFDLARETLDKISKVLNGKRELDEFISNEGGEASNDDDESGIKFNTFTKRKEYNTAYTLSEFALRTYGSSDDIKASGLRRSEEEYDNALVRNVNAYANEKGLTETQRESLIEKLYTNKSKGKVPFHNVASDDRYTLSIRSDDKNFSDRNTWLRSYKPDASYGNFSTQIAWARIQKKIEDMLWGAERGKVSTKNNSIEVKFVDSKGRLQSRKIGDYYTTKDKDEVGNEDDKWNKNGYWFPDISWLMSQPLSITCNFYCYRPYSKTSTPEELDRSNQSRVNFKIVPNRVVDVESKAYNPEETLEPTAYMRTASELNAEYAEAKKLFNINGENPYVRRVFYEAKLNVIVNKMRQLADRYYNKGATDSEKAYLENEYERCEQLHKTVMAQLSGNEKAYARMGIKTELPTASNNENPGSFGPGRVSSHEETQVHPAVGVPKGSEFISTDKPTPAAHVVKQHEVSGPQRGEETYEDKPHAITQLVDFSQEKASGLMETASRIYEMLASGDPQFDLPGCEVQKKMAAAIIRRCQQIVGDGKVAEVRNHVAPEPSAPKYAQDTVDKYTSYVENKEYNTEDAFLDDLHRLAVMEIDGTDVSAVRKSLVERYHQFKMKDMNNEQRMQYLAEAKEYAINNPLSYTHDPDADYDAMLGNVIETVAYGGVDTEDVKRSRRQLRQIRNNAGNYKTERGVNNALKRLEGIEKAGLDVSDVRKMLENNLEALKGDSEPAEQAALLSNATPADATAFRMLEPDGDINLQLLAGNDYSGLPQYEDYLDHTETDAAAGTSEPPRVPRPYRPHAPYNYKPKTPGRFATHIINPNTADIDPVSGMGHAEVDRLGSYGGHVAIPDTEASRKLAKNDNGAAVDDESALKSVRESIKEVQKRIDEIDAELTAASPDADTSSLEQEKAALIEERTRMKAERDSLKKSLYSNDLKTAALVDVSNPEISVFTSNVRTEKALQSANKMHDALKGNAEGELSTYSDEQIKNVLDSAFDENELMENGIYAKELAGDSKRYTTESLRLRLRIECAEANLNGEYAEGINKAIPNNTKFRAALNAYYQDKLSDAIVRGETTAEEENASETVYGAVLNEASDWLDEFNLFPEFETSEISKRILLMTKQAEEYEEMARNAAESSKAMYRMSSKSIEDVINTSNGGRLPVQMMDGFSLLLKNAVDTMSKGRVRKAIMDFGARNLLNPYQVIQAYTGKAAPLVNKIFFEPVIKNNAKLQTLMNDYVTRINGTKITYKNSSDFHRWAEGYFAKGIVDEDEWNERGYITFEGFKEAHVDDYNSEAEMIADLQVFRAIYDETIELANKALRSNGLREIGRLENYLPHTIDKGDGFAAFMTEILDGELPADIAGITGEFKPLHQWNPHALHRSGNKTKFDMIGNFESYIGPVLNTICHTGDIVRLRQLETALRGMTFKDEETGRSGSILQTMNKWVTQYTNQLAGKKTTLDNAVENLSTRGLFVLSNTLKKIRSDSLISGNSKVALSNFLPLVQVAAFDATNTARAIASVIARENTASGSVALNDAMSRSNFLTARNKASMPARNLYRAIVDKGYIPMEMIDSFTSKVVWATCYLNSMSIEGATMETAIARADRMALDMMASKVKGESGIAYNSPIAGTVLQFTAEGINLVNYMCNVMPKYYNGNPAKILKNVILSMLGYWVYNELFAAQSAPDALGTIYHGIKDGEKAWTIAKNVVNELNPVDRFTDGGIGSAPALSGFGDMWKAIDNVIENGFNDKAQSDLLGAFLGFVPMGTQINRTLQGGAALVRGYNKYNGQVRYPVARNAYNVPAALIGGPQATIEGHAFNHGKYSPLSGSAEEQMIALHDHGSSWSDAYNSVIKEKEAAKEKQAVTAGTKVQADVSEHEAKYAEARNEMAMPAEVATLPPEYVKKPAVQKGIEIWKESGVEVYPKKSLSYSSTTYEDTKYVGIQRNGKLHHMTEEEMADLDAWYHREYEMILDRYDPETTTPEDLKKSLDKMEDRIKKDFVAERGDD